MKQYSVRQFNENFSRILAESQGEEILITKHGKPYAHLKSAQKWDDTHEKHVKAYAENAKKCKPSPLDAITKAHIAAHKILYEIRGKGSAKNNKENGQDVGQGIIKYHSKSEMKRIEALKRGLK